MQTDTTSQNTPSVYHFIVLFVSTILSPTVQLSCKLKLVHLESSIVRNFFYRVFFVTLKLLLLQSLKFIFDSLDFVILPQHKAKSTNISTITLHLHQ